MNSQNLPTGISEGLASGATLVVQSPQRQAAIRAAWGRSQREAGRTLWNTPRVVTFAQFAEEVLQSQWAESHLPDRLLPPGAEWAAIRELRRESGGASEARALLTSIRTLHDWGIPSSASALGASPESALLLEALTALERLVGAQDRKPLRTWLRDLAAPPGELLAVGTESLPAVQRATLRRLGARTLERTPHPAPISIAAAQNDEHELELIAGWCRASLERDPHGRLLIVDARLRQRRNLYDRLLSQSLAPSDWVRPEPRAASTLFAIEGGRPLAEFPVIAHALLTLRLLAGRLRFDEVMRWLRLPFLDGQDVMAGTAIEALLREGRKLEFSAEELATILERATGNGAAAALAARLRQALSTLSGARHAPAEWAPRLLTALRQLGWHGARALRSDEQQTVNRWHGLLDEYSALGPWLAQATLADAVSTLADLASERHFDAASVEAPVTLTDSHDDPCVHYDGIWIAGLDAAQWPPPPRPDVFIPLHLQVAAGVPWASAAAQTRSARDSLAAWRASTAALHCSWSQLEGDAHRSPSPLLAHQSDAREYSPSRLIVPLASELHRPALEAFDDTQGIAVDITLPVEGGVKPLALQAECGFRAYAERRLRAEELESPVPGIDPRERGMLMHKALELLWLKLHEHFSLVAETPILLPTIADSVEAAELHVFRGHVPHDLRAAMTREKYRLEKLIEKLIDVERTRTPFTIEALEAKREVDIGGGRFTFRIDRIDSLEGGGFAILDYKSGEPRSLRWNDQEVREPQLLAYLMAERGRDVVALANVYLANNQAKFSGKSSQRGLLPGVNGLPGMNPNKVPAEEIAAAWHEETGRWLHGLQLVAADFIAGRAPVQPAPDVCRNCHLTTLCRRVELAAIDTAGEGA